LYVQSVSRETLYLYICTYISGHVQGSEGDAGLRFLRILGANSSVARALLPVAFDFDLAGGLETGHSQQSGTAEILGRARRLAVPRQEQDFNVFWLLAVTSRQQ
jgi:hypothetical protein